MNNIEVRWKAKENKVALWEIGEYFKVSEVTIVRRLREELSDKEKEKYIDAINKIVAQRAEQVINNESVPATNELSKEAKKNRAAYYREWRKKNPGKASEYCNRYWEKKAKQEEKMKEGT